LLKIYSVFVLKYFYYLKKEVGIKTDKEFNIQCIDGSTGCARCALAPGAYFKGGRRGRLPQTESILNTEKKINFKESIICEIHISIFFNVDHFIKILIEKSNKTQA
jgi:hypothetical protein